MKKFLPQILQNKVLLKRVLLAKVCVFALAGTAYVIKRKRYQKNNCVYLKYFKRFVKL